MPPSISCVVVAFHRRESTAQIAAALDSPEIHTIVVNVEDDPALRSVPGAEVIATKSNVGYAAAVNLGVRAAKGDVVVFMNDDVVVSRESVLELARRVLSAEADVAVPLVLDSAGEPEVTEVIPHHLAGTMLLRGQPIPSIPTRVDAAWAVVVAARTDLLRAVPLPEAYFLYWEELEWFHNIRKRAARIELNPSVKVLHLGGTGVVRSSKSRLMARNAVRCVRRVRGRRAALLAWPNVIGWQARLLLTSVTRRQGRAAVRAHAAGVVAALAAVREI